MSFGGKVFGDISAMGARGCTCLGDFPLWSSKCTLAYGIIVVPLPYSKQESYNNNNNNNNQ